MIVSKHQLLVELSRCAIPNLWIQQSVHTPELMLLLVNKNNDKIHSKNPIGCIIVFFFFKSISFTEDRCMESRWGINFTQASEQTPPIHQSTHRHGPVNTAVGKKSRKDEDSAQKNRTHLLYQHFLHFLELESHSKGDQAWGGGSRRGGDGCQGSRFQSIHGPAGNGDVIIKHRFW